MPTDEATDSEGSRFLAELPPEGAALAARLRARVRAHVPDAEERVYRGWGGLGYHVRGAGYVFAIFPRATHVDVGFEHGAALADARGLFYRGGKQLRYVRLDEWDEERVDAILELVDAAVEWQLR